MYDNKHFTRDVSAGHIKTEIDAVTVDESDNSYEIDWDELETVTVTNPPHANAFDTKTFHKIPTTVAKPIPQPYQYGEDTVWLKKPRDALKSAAWSLDNAPWTLDHPDTGMVKRTEDVHGYWSSPRYIDATDDLDADLYVPTHDTEAKEFIEDNPDVSVGFYNRIARTDEYDGVVGGTDNDEITIEGYQTDMMFDHVASVGIGRCPSTEGCGFGADAADSRSHGHIDTFDSKNSVGDWVEWDASGGTTYGKIDEIIREGCTTRGKGDMEVCAEGDDPAVVVEVYDDETGESKDEMVRHKMSELRMWSGTSGDAGTTSLMAQKMEAPQFSEGDMVQWQVRDDLFGQIVAVDDESDVVMVEVYEAVDGELRSTGFVISAGYSDVTTVTKESLMAGRMSNSDKSLKNTVGITDENEDANGNMDFETDQPDGIYVADGTWFAVGPDEHPDETTEWPDNAKFRVDNCADVTDAWNLRGTGDISIEQSTLEERIKRAAEAMDCDMPDTAEMDSADVALSAKKYSVCGSRKEVMDNCPCDKDNTTNDTINMEINFDDLSTEAAIAKVEAQNDGVSERLDKLRAAEDAAETAYEAADELGVDDVESLADSVAMLKEQKESLAETVDELQRPEMESDAAFIAEQTDRFGETAEDVIEKFDGDAEAVADKRELVAELTEEYDEQTANSEESSSDGLELDSSGKYVKTPWE